jgi:hypothetical protein
VLSRSVFKRTMAESMACLLALNEHHVKSVSNLPGSQFCGNGLNDLNGWNGLNVAEAKAPANYLHN